MTEEEAKTKWCPMGAKAVELPGNIVATVNDNEALNTDWKLNCIASDCMMWVARKEVLKTSDEGINYFETEGGHCGLSRTAR